MLHDKSLMSFGTHKGKCLKDIPDRYWLWFLSQPWSGQWPELVEYARCCESDDDE